jgi:RNA polymerase sigma factor (sigma-70 family)
MCTYTDAEWVRLLKEEPRSAEVERCLWEELYRFCWCQMRNRDFDEQLATDCAVDAYRRIVRSIGSFRFECSFRSWCRIIAANCANTIGGREGKRRGREEPLPETEAEEPAAPDDASELRADADTILARLRPCLNALPKRQRQVIELLYLTRDENGEFVEQPREAVAAQLGINAGAVAVAAFHARVALQRCLRSLGYESADDILFL